MRSRSKCGVLSCHLCCSTGFSLCHSFCPLPASAHPTVRCHSTCPAAGVWLPTAKLWLSRREESSQWNQRLPVTQLWLFQVYQFLWQQKSTLRAELQLDGFPSRLHLQSFSLGSQSTNGTFSHFYHLDVWCSPPHSENVNVITCGGWGVGFCELFHWWWDMHSNFSSY